MYAYINISFGYNDYEDDDLDLSDLNKSRLDIWKGTVHSGDGEFLEDDRMRHNARSGFGANKD
ncbi:hypothetical protein CsatB_005269 [Cannabis sativa]